MTTTSHTPVGRHSVIRFAMPVAAVAALATQADAAIIYTDVSATIGTVSATDYISIDMGDGVGGGGSLAINSPILSGGDDFTLFYGDTTNTEDGGAKDFQKPKITGRGAPAAEIAYAANFAVRFTAGEPISDTNYYTSDQAIYNNVLSGPWNPGTTGYLGVRFTDASANLHYGWIGLAYGSDFALTVNGFAYESAPDAEIAAGAVAIPEPASVAAMAAALAGSVALMRRRQVRA